MPTEKTAVLLVDWDNFSRGARREGAFPNVGALVDAAMSAGYRVVYKTVFVNAAPLTRKLREALHLNGFRIVDCPNLQGKGAEKSSVDFVLIAHMGFCAQFVNVDAVILVSQDKDFVSAGSTVRGSGREFVVAQFQPERSDERSMLSRSATRVISYGKLLPAHRPRDEERENDARVRTPRSGTGAPTPGSAPRPPSSDHLTEEAFARLTAIVSSGTVIAPDPFEPFVARLLPVLNRCMTRLCGAGIVNRKPSPLTFVEIRDLFQQEGAGACAGQFVHVLCKANVLIRKGGGDAETSETAAHVYVIDRRRRYYGAVMRLIAVGEAEGQSDRAAPRSTPSSASPTTDDPTKVVAPVPSAPAPPPSAERPQPTESKESAPPCTRRNDAPNESPADRFRQKYGDLATLPTTR